MWLRYGRFPNGPDVVAYKDPAWLAQRHGLGEAAKPIIAKLQTLLAGLAKEAAA